MEKCIQFVAKHLTKDGCLYANVTIGTKDPGSWQGFPVIWRRLENYQLLASNYGLKTLSIGKLKEFGHISITHPLEDEQEMLKIFLK